MSISSPRARQLLNAHFDQIPHLDSDKRTDLEKAAADLAITVIEQADAIYELDRRIDEKEDDQ